MAASASAHHVLTNEQNRGFIGTVNRGFAETEGDVVLLNSDTIVTRGWLDKIRRCAASDPTASRRSRRSPTTPRSARIRQMCGNHDWVPGDDPEIYNDAIAIASRRDYPELPTGVGFCMYVRRATLNAIGHFDMQYGLGYGEENDFCRRLVAAGYRNVLLDDTFVAHVGNRSFDAKKAALVEREFATPRLALPRLSADRPGIHRRRPARGRHDCSRGASSASSVPADVPASSTSCMGAAAGPSITSTIWSSAIPQYRHYVLVALGDRWEVDDLADGPGESNRVRVRAE